MTYLPAGRTAVRSLKNNLGSACAESRKSKEKEAMKKTPKFVVFAAQFFAVAFCLQAAPSSAYDCAINLAGVSDCVDPVTVLSHNAADREAKLQINAQDFTEIIITVYYQSVEGWITDIGSSITNNGAGGDSGTNSFDSEVDLLIAEESGRLEFRAFANDYFGLNYGIVYDIFDPDSSGYAVITYVITDGQIDVYEGTTLTWPNIITRFAGEGFFRFLGWDEEAEADNDRQFFIGLNRVINDAFAGRDGAGAVFASFTLN